jgi:hypothetical protein
MQVKVLECATFNAYQSPYEKLYNKSPDHQKLPVFACLCYHLLRPYGIHKLEYKSKPCIFLGYQYADYKCLDPITSKVYLSRHIVFDETSFPAKDHTAALLPSQLPSTGDATLTLPLMPSFSSNSSPILLESLSSAAPSDPSSSTSAAVPPTSPSIDVILQDIPSIPHIHSLVAPPPADSTYNVLENI